MFELGSNSTSSNALPETVQEDISLFTGFKLLGEQVEKGKNYNGNPILSQPIAQTKDVYKRQPSAHAKGSGRVVISGNLSIAGISETRKLSFAHSLS